MADATFHIGNAAGFANDRLDAGAPVVAALIASGAPAALSSDAFMATERDPACEARNDWV